MGITVKKSCGFLIQCNDNFLLCHSSIPSGNIGLHDQQWGIPKGGCEEGETELETAIREVAEETNIRITDYSYNQSPIFSYSTKSKKYVIFHCKISEDDKEKLNLNCASLIPETNRPENDGFMWVSWDKARDIAIRNQKFNLFTNEVLELIK